MDYQEAKKLVQTEKHKENFLRIKLDYNRWLILPYKDGLQFLASLATALELEEQYSSPPYLGPIRDKERFEAYPIAAKDVERFRIATLLQVTMTDLQQAENQANQPTPTS